MAGTMAAPMRAHEYRGPVIGSLALHAVIVLLLSLNLSFCNSELKLPPVPAHVRAVVMEAPSMSAPAVLPQLAPPVEQPAPPPKPEVKKPQPQPAPPKPEPRKLQPVPKPQPKPVPVKKPEPVKPVAKTEPKKPEAKPKPVLPASDLDAMMADEDRDLAARDAAQRVAADKAARDKTARDAEEQKTVLQYAQLIRNELKRRWNRPPTARNGMETTLRITLIPGGEVVDVQVVKSSGDAAFDRAAENAVRLAGRLPVPSDPDLFNRQFRRLNMPFRKEDLEK